MSWIAQAYAVRDEALPDLAGGCSWGENGRVPGPAGGKHESNEQISQEVGEPIEPSFLTVDTS